MKCSISIAVLILTAFQLLQVESRQVKRVNGTCNSFETEVINEGKKQCVYNDHIGSPIIGLGFNLEGSDAEKQMSNINADHELIRAGRACLNETQIRWLFDSVMNVAVRCASSWLSSVWSKMSEERQSAVADMAFNMGCSRLKTFKKMKAALERQDYGNAEYEMKDSRWCRQMKSRCDRAAKCMRNE